MVAGDVAGRAVRDPARAVAEGVPDAGALAVLGRRPLDLVRRGAGTEPEARWKQRVRHGDHCVGDRHGSTGFGPVRDPRSGTSDASLILVRIVVRPRARLVRTAVRAQRRPAAAGAGYDAHEHADVVLVTWVVSGALAHEDATGDVTQPAGQLAVTRAGTGITHSERADNGVTRFVQAWLRPGRAGGEPSRRTTTPDLSSGTLVVVADEDDLGIPGATLRIADVPGRCDRVRAGRPRSATSSSRPARSPARAWPSPSPPATPSRSPASTTSPSRPVSRPSCSCWSFGDADVTEPARRGSGPRSGRPPA